MQVILRQDVEGVGTAGQVLDVADGFARNHLIPSKLAMRATAGAVRQSEDMTRARADRAVKARAEAERVAGLITSKGVTVYAQVGEGESLYGSVSKAEIAAALVELADRLIDQRDVELDAPIRTLGTHTASVRLEDDFEVEFSVEILAG